MLYVPLYHRVDRAIETHFVYFKQSAQVVLPGEPLSTPFSVCLTFDDATRDFYEIAFPLLKRHRLRALLAVPVDLIGREGFCSWDQLKEMAHSGSVEIASHSVYHHNLIQTSNLDKEIKSSKQILQHRLGVSVKTFVYPYGKFNHTIHQQVKQEYEFVMRIGTSWNRDWQNRSGMIYRIVVDPSLSPETFFSFNKKITYFWFYHLNSLRNR